MRYCSTCGQLDANATGMCQRCADGTALRCPTCAQPVPPGNRFCGQCGARITVAPSPADAPSEEIRRSDSSAPAWPAGHTRGHTHVISMRREVTVLFLDVTNFTAASHTLDSEDVFTWIDETMRLLAAVVRKYEGTIDKFTGDGLMALFGAPAAHENDPELAVRTALEMQQIINPLRERIKQKHSFDFQMRIGINTGTVIAGSVGDQLHTEYTVLGDTVNLASRLEKAADPGTILISDTTYQRTWPLFEYVVMPPLLVKGISDPLQTYRPTQLRERPGSVRSIPGVRAPMIGRAHLLAHLCMTMDKIRRQTKNQIALITGEAGLGKSRLVVEFRSSLSETDTRCYQGGCLAYARSTPLWVIADMLRDMLRVSEIDPPNIQLETLRAYLIQIGLSNQDIQPYLSNVLGLADADAESRLRLMDASMLQRQTHAALRQLFLAEAARGPTVLIFEDLHWVDPASRDFLEYLVQTTSDVPLLLLLVSRDSERQTVVRPLIAAAETLPDQLLDIQLQALSDAEGEALLDQLIRQETHEARDLKSLIARRAAGVPFYIEEIVRILIDHGGLVDVAGGWQVTQQAQTLLQEVPGTLKGLILTRFDRLSEAMRYTLQQAAVLGRSFPANLLQILGGTSPAIVAAQVQELVARQFLVAEPFGWAQGYAFRHVLIQEAIYSTLLKRHRQQLHEQVAQLIERAAFWPHDEQIEVLAYHYAESSMPARAVPYLIEAAENAARRYANETAIRHYQRAIDLMQTAGVSQHDDFFRARLGLGQALKFVGQFAEASQILSQALTPLQGYAGETRLALFVNMVRELADVRQRERGYDEAITHLEAGLRTLGTIGRHDKPVLWRSLMDRMAWIRFRQGQQDEALILAQKALQGVHMEYADDPITLASLCNTIGGVFWQRGALTDAIVYVERSLQLYKSLSYAWGMAIAYTNLGVLHYACGVWAKAVENFEQAYVLRRQNGYLPEQALNLHNLGTLRMEMGEHAQALRDLEESRAISQRLGDPFGIVCAEIGLTRLAIVQSHFAEAAMHAERVQELLASAGEEEAIQIRWLQALIYAARGDTAAGLTCAEEALAMARAAQQSEQEPECLRVLGLLSMRCGDNLEAERLFYASLAASQRLKDTYRQGLALLELGRLYERSFGSGPNRSRALSMYISAAQLFEQLGASYDLQVAQIARERCQGDLGTAAGYQSRPSPKLPGQLVEKERAMAPI